jgi:hypothetical protein
VRTYRFGLQGSDRVIEIVAASLTEAKQLLREQLLAEGLL